jgi:Domain of unknown function (DUF4145)
MSTSINCPHCHRYTDLRQAQHTVSARYTPDLTQDIKVPASWNENNSNDCWIGVCNACQNPVLVLAGGALIYPNPRPTPTDNNIPEDIRIDLDEAKRCFVSSCYRGCAVLARRVIQVTGLSKGAQKKNLVEQIDELFTTGVITNDIKEWATVVRWIGNDAAHSDKQAVTREDAKDCLDLAEQFLHVIFVTPAIANARKAERGK